MSFGALLYSGFIIRMTHTNVAMKSHNNHTLVDNSDQAWLSQIYRQQLPQIHSFISVTALFLVIVMVVPEPMGRRWEYNLNMTPVDFRSPRTYVSHSNSTYRQLSIDKSIYFTNLQRKTNSHDKRVVERPRPYSTLQSKICVHCMFVQCLSRAENTICDFTPTTQATVFPFYLQ